jgi:hypothetical protein
MLRPAFMTVEASHRIDIAAALFKRLRVMQPFARSSIRSITLIFVEHHPTAGDTDKALMPGADIERRPRQG